MQDVTSKRHEIASSDQCAFDGQCVFHMIDGHRSVKRNADPESLYPHYTAVLNLAGRISNEIKKTFLIWTFERGVDQRIRYRK